ncbi:MAG: hypothetical protein R3195_10910 [Gemmatimonadota bacterium]|nr:hypothetical protein [Gemmatimonadota bacterium]
MVALAAARPTVSQSIELAFTASDPQLEEATVEYRELWAAEGDEIVRALERWSGLEFAVDRVPVEVMEGPSWAGTASMGMRASYPPETKRGTLAHELGHILIGDLIPEDEEGEPVYDHHAFMYLFLYEAWIDLWGQEFADGQVAVESRRRGINDYEGKWRAALAMTAAERRAELESLIAEWRGR